MYNNDPKYMNPPEAGLASLLSSRGRNGDSVLVHMAPEELQGLQSLAMAHGGQLTVNPETGLYEASFLKKILPMIAGAVLPSIPGVGQFAKTIGFGSEALGTALLVGGATGLIEGDLKKGLMAGLGAYSGATLSEGLKAASIAGRPDEAIAGATPVAEAAKAGQAVDAARGTVGATAEATRLSDVGGVFTPKMTTPPAISGISIKPVDYTPYTPPPPTPSVMGGISALMRPEGRTAFMGAMGGGFQSPLAQNLSKYAVMTGVADALTPQPKAMPMGGGASEDIVYIPGAFNPQYGSGKDQPFQLPGRYYKRTPQGLVPYNPFQLAPGARGFAQGGSVQSPMQGPIKVSPYAMPTEDPNVLATRAYIEELNRRARNPYAVGGGGMGGAGGLGSFGTPGTYQPSDGGVVGGGESGGGLGAIAGGIAANYLINKGIGAGVDYLRDKFGGEQQQPYKEPISDSLQAVDHATLPTTMAAVDQLSALNVAPPKTYSYQVEEVPDVAPQPAAPTTPATSAIPYTLGALNALSPFAAAPSAIPVVGEPVYDALGQVTGFKYPDGTIEPVEGYQRQPDTLDADLQAKTRVGGDMSAPLSSYLSAGSSGLAGLASLGSAAKTGLTSIIPLDPATGAVQTFLSPGSSAAANAAAAESAKAAGAEVAGAGTGAGAASKIIPGLQAALGLYEAYKGIESGEEGRAALGGFGAGAGIATLAGATPGFGALAAAGPIGLAAAAIAAIGASMVNTKEFGDVALRNYWNAVDQGRGIGETDPVELAQGFINFYRTNKNNFAGQEKYGRTGNEDFVYDMTQVINNAVKDGKIDKNVDAATMYQQVVQPWLNSMGSGPQNEDAKRIQDFMITDLINSFMQGKPISNAQVKGDSKFKIVSEKPVYAGAAQPTPELALPTTPDIQDLIRQAAPPVQLGGDEYPIGTPMPVRATTPVPEEPYYMPEYDRFNPFAEDYASMPFERMSRYAGGGAIGEGYNFGFAGGGMPPQPEYRAGGKLLRGRGDGMSDDIPAVIRGKGEQRAALADGEFVIPADVVSHLGNGSTNAGAKKLYQMMARVRQARTGKKKQAPAVNMNRYMPA